MATLNRPAVRVSLEKSGPQALHALHQSGVHALHVLHNRCSLSLQICLAQQCLPALSLQPVISSSYAALIVMPMQVMFVLFAVATTLWAIVVFRAGGDRHRVHYLMTALAAAKTLTLLSSAGMYHFIQATGRPDGWNIAYYVFTFLRGLLFFTVCCHAACSV